MAHHISGYPTTAGGTSFNPEFSSVVQAEHVKNFSREGAKMRVANPGEYAPGTLLARVGSGESQYFTPVTNTSDAVQVLAALELRFNASAEGDARVLDRNDFAVKDAPTATLEEFVGAFNAAADDAARTTALRSRYNTGAMNGNLEVKSGARALYIVADALQKVGGVDGILVGPGMQDKPTQMVNFKAANTDENVTVLTRGPAILLRDADTNKAGQGGIPMRYKKATDDDLMSGTWLFNNADGNTNASAANEALRDAALEKGITAIGGSVKVYGRDSVLGYIVGN